MYEILKRLNKIEGMHGTLVMGKDGLVVAADLGTDADENAVAAVASQILSSLQGALDRMGMGGLRTFSVTGREGKVVLADAGSVVLVALLDLDANVGLVAVEIKEAVNRLREKLSP